MIRYTNKHKRNVVGLFDRELETHRKWKNFWGNLFFQDSLTRTRKLFVRITRSLFFLANLGKDFQSSKSLD